MLSELEYWSDYAAAGGRALGAIAPVFACTMGVAVDGSDECRLEAPAAVLSPVQRGHVIRGVDALGVVREYRVRTRARTLGAPTRTVTGLSPRDELARAGAITQTLGGITSVDVAGAYTPTQWLDTIILPFLAAKGLGYFVRGTMDYTGVVDLVAQANGYTPLSMLLAIQSALGGEIRVRRVGETQYAIDHVVKIGAGAPVVPVGTARNLRELQETEDDEGIVSAITPLGLTPTGEALRATLGENAWTAGTPLGAGPYWVPLTDPGGGDPPIAFDNQFGTGGQAAYLLLKDATTVPITGSRKSDSAVQVASLTGITAGDLVQLVADSAGNRLIELTNPDISPRNAKVADLTLRGERNLARNGRFDSWVNANEATHWAPGGSSSTNVKGSRYPRNAALAWSGTITANYNAGTTYNTVSYTGLAPGAVLLSREVLRITNGVQTVDCTIADSVGLHEADGSGAGTVAVNNFTPAVSFTSGMAVSGVSLRRPSGFPTEGPAQAYALYLTGTANSAPPVASNARLQSLPFKVKYLTGFGTVRAAVGYTYRSLSATGAVTAAAALVDTVTGAPNGTLLATVSSAASFSAAGTIHETLACAASIVADRTLALALYNHATADVGVFARWATLWIGSGETPPPLADAPFANGLWQKTNRELVARALGVRSIRLTLRDLSAVLGYMITAEQLTLGGDVLVEDLGLRLRVVAITYDLLDPQNTQIVVDSRPASLVRYLEERT